MEASVRPDILSPRQNKCIQPECSQKLEYWKMLESVACAFGWINPLLGQMAPSPCRANKPQSACRPSLHVFPSFTNKKKEEKVRLACPDHHSGQICLFVFRNIKAVRCPLLSYLLVSMQFLEKDPEGRASVSSWKIWTLLACLHEWLVDCVDLKKRLICHFVHSFWSEARFIRLSSVVPGFYP